MTSGVFSVVKISGSGSALFVFSMGCADFCWVRSEGFSDLTMLALAAGDAGGDEVYGLVDGDEFVEELIVVAPVFVAEGDVVGRGEMFKFFGAKAVFDGVAGGFLLPCRGDGAF